MNKEWPNQEKDMQVAKLIIDEYAQEVDTDSLGLFELVVDEQKKSNTNLRLSGWVVALSRYFNKLYGAEQGNFVTKMVISRCITSGQTIH
jgi:hypothetical protein